MRAVEMAHYLELVKPMMGMGRWLDYSRPCCFRRDKVALLWNLSRRYSLPAPPLPLHWTELVSADSMIVAHIIQQYWSTPAMLQPEQPVDRADSTSLKVLESNSFLALCGEVRDLMVKATRGQKLG